MLANVRALVTGDNPKGHPMLFCVVLKDRRAWEGMRYGKTPKTVAYLCLLKTAKFIPFPRIPLASGPPSRNGTLPP